MKSLPYHEQKDIENVKKLREIIKELPPFCVDSVSYTHLDVYKRQPQWSPDAGTSGL